MEQEMPAEIDRNQINSAFEKPAVPQKGLEDLFDKMQIQVMGGTNEESKSEGESSGDNDEIEEEDHF